MIRRGVRHQWKKQGEREEGENAHRHMQKEISVRDDAVLVVPWMCGRFVLAYGHNG